MAVVKEPAVSEPVEGLTLPDRTTLLAFLSFVLISGGSSVAIRFTYAELPTFFGGMARFLLGALFFWVFALVRKIPLPRGRALLGAFLFGVTSMGSPLHLFTGGW